MLLAFIAGVTAYGLVPLSALHDPSSRNQLDRIYDLIARSDYSFHDLSWVLLDAAPPHTPRFNMPFELGMAVTIARTLRPWHQWFLFDTDQFRLQKALSDLGGFPPHIHDGTSRGALVALMNALARETHQPELAQLLEIYRIVEKAARRIRRQHANTLFASRAFDELVYVASVAAHTVIPSLRA